MRLCVSERGLAIGLTACLSLPASGQEAKGYAVPGAGFVEEEKLVAILSNYIADAGCTLDFTDYDAAAQATLVYVGESVGLAGAAMDTALPALGSAVEQSFDAMLAEGLVTVDADTRTAGLINCEP